MKMQLDSKERSSVAKCVCMCVSEREKTEIEIVRIESVRETERGVFL